MHPEQRRGPGRDSKTHHQSAETQPEEAGKLSCCTHVCKAATLVTKLQRCLCGILSLGTHQVLEQVTARQFRDDDGSEEDEQRAPKPDPDPKPQPKHRGWCP